MYNNKDIQPLVYIDRKAIRSAIVEAQTDIGFVLDRRKKLIGDNRPSQGKIAGIIFYRLTKTKIFHLCEPCLKCSCDNCKMKMFNIYFPLKTALDYMNIEYRRLPVEIRKEIIYSVIYRHTNQETLGLVFDVLLNSQKK